MDEVAKYNKARWKALADANALFTRPKLDLTFESAKELVNSDDRFGELNSKKVLCLAGGGGQQSAAFSLLGSDVMVFDISKEQLERDKKVAEHYGVEIETFQGDMRNLSVLENDFYDIVHHPYSLNFVSNAMEVFGEVSRILKNGGSYQVQFANPFVMSTRQEDWNGEGYVLKAPYMNNAEITYADQNWVYNKNENETILQPKEFRHNLGDLMNGLINLGFIIRSVSDNDSMYPDSQSEPGTWNHFVAYAPPWLSLLAVYKPDLKF